MGAENEGLSRYGVINTYHDCLARSTYRSSPIEGSWNGLYMCADTWAGSSISTWISISASRSTSMFDRSVLLLTYLRLLPFTLMPILCRVANLFLYRGSTSIFRRYLLDQPWYGWIPGDSSPSGRSFDYCSGLSSQSNLDGNHSSAPDYCKS